MNCGNLPVNWRLAYKIQPLLSELLNWKIKPTLFDCILPDKNDKKIRFSFKFSRCIGLRLKLLK